jgi:hypothetical protein
MGSLHAAVYHRLITELAQLPCQLLELGLTEIGLPLG